MNHSRGRQQSGMALLVTLVLIALMALLAFSGSEATRLQQRLATNDQAAQTAFQAAEAALREAINTIDDKAPYLTGFCNSAGSSRYNIDIDDMDTDDGHSRLEDAYEIEGFQLGDGSGIAMTKQPRYLVACIDKPDSATPPSSYYFRIYAQGFGPSGQISRIIEARYVYKK